MNAEASSLGEDIDLIVMKKPTMLYRNVFSNVCKGDIVIRGRLKRANMLSHQANERLP
jgi:hypothetical protein